MWRYDVILLNAQYEYCFALCRLRTLELLIIVRDLYVDEVVRDLYVDELYVSPLTMSVSCLYACTHCS